MTVPASCNSWTVAAIAALTPADISRLNYDEIVELIASAEHGVRQTDASLPTESVVLIRRVYALRDRCRVDLLNE